MFIQFLFFIPFSCLKAKNNGLCFEIIVLFRALLHSETVQCHLLMLFGTKTMKCSKELPDLTHYSPVRIILLAPTVYLLLKFKKSILGHFPHRLTWDFAVCVTKTCFTNLLERSLISLD